MMNKDIINWLLEGPTWLKYAVELQLLDKKPDIKSAIQDDLIINIINRLKGNRFGIPALRTGMVSCEDTGNAYWDLFFLADIGFSANNLKLNKEVEEIFDLQSPDGTFITEMIMSPDYFCVSAIILSSVVRMGYKDDSRIGKYIQVILDSQLLDGDGGWHCKKGHGFGYVMQNKKSCPMDNLNILMLLGQYEKYRKDPRFNGSIDFLLEHWERRDEKLILDGFGVGRRFKSLTYPAVLYGILRVLDVLSLFPYAIVSKGFKSMLAFVRLKSSGGKYFAESVVDSCSGFDFAQKEEPSRWITFLITRIEKRISSNSIMK
ncbi:MAG: hypothetical protein SV062_12990 [Thermodesulfobacteriota bacterium]|nr:hypothetical protein [Thermodesulfobacteriota bacterium]